MKKINVPLALGILVFNLNACGTAPVSPERALREIELSGLTMGKIQYKALYIDTQNRNFQKEVDQLLADFNREMSTYIPESTISTFNKLETEQLELGGSQHFIRNINLAKLIYTKTEGWFNPAVMPLVNYWGFGYTERKPVERVDSNRVDSLVKLADFSQISLEGSVIYKKQKGAQLDFSAIAKGDAVDELSRFLEQKGIGNYMVEIGGEVRARGKTDQNRWWYIGVNTPDTNASTSDFEYVIELKNRAMATSGNYRNFYTLDDKRYGHTINPKTGYPEPSDLLSATVIAKDCATADAYATAFMAMGRDKAYTIAKNNPDIEAFFIFLNDENEFEKIYTDKLKDVLKE